jgi:hypothetical protein
MQYLRRPSIKKNCSSRMLAGHREGGGKYLKAGDQAALIQISPDAWRQ